MNRTDDKIEYEFLKDAHGVIHVGASFGQERDIYAGAGLPVIWLEAHPGVFRSLLDNLAIGYSNQKALNYLITDEDDLEYPFNVANNDGMSSSIFPLGEHKDIWPDIGYVETLCLKSKTLDTALAGEDLAVFDTLVLDVQGAELKALRGATETLKGLKYIRCEAADFPIYEGGALDCQLDDFLAKQGFQRIQTWHYKETIPLSGRNMLEILYQRASTVKNTRILDPVTGREGWAKVGVVTSVPRLGFQIHSTVVRQAFGTRGWPVIKVGGAFWEQAIQKGLNVAVQLGCDYIFTIDYDSIFSAEDVNEMLALAIRYPEADAITSWQPQREGGDRSLIGLKDENGVFMDRIPLNILQGDVTRVDHTVFGLTVIKTSSLIRMPKPWFRSAPNAEGEWEDGKVDADGYFWDKWGKTGLTIYVANNVKIGHLFEGILWVDSNFNLIQQRLPDFYEKGRPF